MKLQDRDIQIINYIEKYGGTIQQIANLFFDSSYDAAKHRLKKLQDDKFIKGANHSIVNKKVYYKRKMPSYHGIIAQDIFIKNREVIQDFKREAKLDKYMVDVFIITKKLNIYIIEIDIFNKTKKEKLDSVSKYVKTKLNKQPKIIVLSKTDIEQHDIITLAN